MDYGQNYLTFFFIAFFFGKINKLQQRPLYHFQMSFTNNNKPNKVARHGRTTNLMWKHVHLLKDDDPRWLGMGKDKITHQCKYCSWTKAVAYAKSNKNGIVSYNIGQVERYLMSKHYDIDC